jgi:hypothetical protein
MKMGKFEALWARYNVKFDQIYAPKFDARGSNLTQPLKVKFK